MSSVPDGIRRALAVERAARVRDLRYAIDLDITADRTAPIRGVIVLSFALADDDRAPLALDFAPNARGRLEACICNGMPFVPAQVNDHIVLPGHVLRPSNHVRLEFSAGDAPLNRREDSLYTIFVPARAHEAFPCFDQPDLKARFTLALRLPDGWTAVSNGIELSPDDRAHDAPPDRPTIQFAETEPIPTYLFAFAAGPFVVETLAAGDRTIRVLHRESDRDRLARNLPAIVAGHAQALDWLEEYTGIAYPFGKLDIVLVPAFQFSGMEHPGAIFYNAATLLLDTSATRQQQLARAHVVAHETAHMWFGNLVTMTWFDDVWLKEVFANLMAAKIVDPLFPDLDHDLRFFHSHYAAAYDVDRTDGAHPIRQPLDNLIDAGSLYGAIVYLKSPIVMRQMELALGETGVRDVLREYLRRHQFGNASWPELVTLLSARALFDVDAWSRAWIDEAGRPVVRAETSVADGCVERLTVHQSDVNSSRALLWPQHLEVALGYGSDTVHLTVLLATATVDVDIARGKAAPDYVLPNGRGLGYGHIQLDGRSRAWLLERLPEVADPLTRAAAWLTLWDAMLHGSVAPASLTDVAMRLVAHETNDLNLQRVLTSLDRLFWVFMSGRERMHLAARLETILRDAVHAAPATATKAALFACLRSVATTHEAIESLRALWAGDAAIPGLLLSDTDRISLAQELAVRPGGEQVVRMQIERMSSGEGRDRLVFVAPALSADPHERGAFVDRLADVESRRREPWVLEGLRWLHHPLRVESATQWIAPGLELLEEVKRSGDIFLPKRWLDAMLGGHRSGEAAQEVRAFLASRPATYPLALRRMVLASADALFRIADGVVKS